jgi:competence protein ComEA
MWVAGCAAGAPIEHVPTGAAMTLGVRLNLNEATADDLILVPGIGPALAKALVAARSQRSGFRSWEEVDAVTGVGPAKLRTLQQWTELR